MRGAFRTRPARGFSLLEALLAGIVLAGGTVAMVQASRLLLGQIESLDRSEGHGVVVERLVMQQVAAILTRTPLDNGARFPVVPPTLESSGLAYEVRLSSAAQAGCVAGADATIGNVRCDPVDVWVVLRTPSATDGAYPDIVRPYRVGQGAYVTPRVRVWPRKGYPWLRPLL
ncbi:MAG: hypothetical protein VKO21_02745 [Candidatus Sericytochromatia bacterium]|nr:hypothetical protein [Candidatus Sericytochromatia bacterium]